MRDLCQRTAAFKPLSGWAIELLCEKAIGSNFGPVPPGEAFRRVLEAVSSGIFLPGKTEHTLLFVQVPLYYSKVSADSYVGDVNAYLKSFHMMITFYQISK